MQSRPPLTSCGRPSRLPGPTLGCPRHRRPADRRCGAAAARSVLLRAQRCSPHEVPPLISTSSWRPAGDARPRLLPRGAKTRQLPRIRYKRRYAPRPTVCENAPLPHPATDCRGCLPPCVTGVNAGQAELKGQGLAQGAARHGPPHARAGLQRGSNPRTESKSDPLNSPCPLCASSRRLPHSLAAWQPGCRRAQLAQVPQVAPLGPAPPKLGLQQSS